MPDQTRIVSPGPRPGRVRADDGALLTPPDDWALLPPGDAGLTRRVKAAGPSWTVQEKRGRKLFSRGVWAPAAHIEQARAALDAERATPAYEKRRAGDQARRERAQTSYVGEFEAAVRAFLGFHSRYAAEEAELARRVTTHATPVGSGTVARTERIPVERRAEAAVIAWMRHQTTAYEHLHIARVKGRRREVRRQLAETSRRVLEVYRRGDPASPECPLRRTLNESVNSS